MKTIVCKNGVPVKGTIIKGLYECIDMWVVDVDEYTCKTNKTIGMPYGAQYAFCKSMYPTINYFTADFEGESSGDTVLDYLIDCCLFDNCLPRGVKLFRAPQIFVGFDD